MLTIQVCVGSSCFLKGSKKVIAEIEDLIAEFQLEDKILLKGCFCHEKCTGGVTVTIGEKLYTGIKPENVVNIFKQEILPAVNEGTKCL